MPAPIENLQEQSEELMSLARSMVGGGSRYMKVVYARRPYKDANTGRPLQMAGWITWLDDDPRELWRLMDRGWRPMRKYGHLGSTANPGAPDEEGPWARILKHRDGPSEFPLDQLLEFGWFDRERVPVRGVQFPQLKGIKVSMYPCPECSDRVFQKPIHLARHCRNAHSYDRKDIQDMAEQLDINLVKEMYGDRQRLLTYDYTEDGPESEPIVEPDFEIEQVAVQPRGFLPPKPRANLWTPERKAEASRKARERLAARA